MLLKKIAEILQNGGVVIFPTETLYGLFCDATNPIAIQKIIQIKNRPINKSFPILVQGWKMLRNYSQISPKQEKLLKKLWQSKQPTTVILYSKNLPSEACQSSTAGHLTAAFRISPHSKIKALLRIFHKPLIATSANISGQKPISDPRHYQKTFQEKSALIDEIFFDGINRKQRGSRIIDLTNSRITIVRI